MARATKKEVEKKEAVKKEIIYTGKALKLHEKVVKLETDLKTAKAELKSAYKEQLKAEKLAEAKAKKEAAIAAKKALKEKQKELLDAIQASGKTPDEIIKMLKG